MKAVLLNGSDWTLRCYWQHQWRLKTSADQSLKPALPVMPAKVPGAIHADLLAAGVIGDWQNGLNAMRCEWVNNRDWGLRRTVTVPEDFTGRLTLDCEGLDYSGHVLVNGDEIATFEGTHFRHQFDLTKHVGPGETFELEMVFDIAPQVEGVFGYTSRTRVFKPRFGYYWDWCTRLVNVGIWQDIRLVCRGASRFRKCRVLPRVHSNLLSGEVRVGGNIDGAPATMRYVLSDQTGQTVKCGEVAVDASELDVQIGLDRVELWWPAHMGDQPLYHLKLELLDDRGRTSDRIERTIGFKQVRWLKNPDAPEDARPYLCEVNGRQVFLRGVNWVPLSPLYGTVSAEQYETFLQLYERMNVNLIRVWGGAILETPAFYRQCDRQGIMVWQEFPLSSSGIDNWPPEDPDTIEHLQSIATEFVERRCHHACHVIWCGGNELQGGLDGGKVGIGRPVDETHPLMRRWLKLVEQLDPGKRFQATSPTGPRFYAYEGDFGKGIHHQTHGPWGNRPMAERFYYFNEDDSLFRSETGVPGCSSMAELVRHKGDHALWPPRDDNPHWLVPASNWIPWDDVIREFGPVADDPALLPLVVKASRYLQADSYRFAAEAVRRKHPRCCGFLIWMGHDSVHCTANNSVIEIDGSTKPAYDWLQRAFAPRHIALRYDSICFEPGQPIRGEVWILRDDAKDPVQGNVTANLRTLDGEIVETLSLPARGNGESLKVAEMVWTAPRCSEGLFVIELIWEQGDERVVNRYLLSQQIEHPFEPMRALRPAELKAMLDHEGRVTVSNTGEAAAVGVRVFSTRAGIVVMPDLANVLLFPGESHTMAVRHVTAKWCPSGEGGGSESWLAVECFNADSPVPVEM